jgi:hypothetical protein
MTRRRAPGSRARLCPHLVWGLARGPEPITIRAAYLYTYLGEARIGKQMARETSDSIHELRANAFQHLKTDRGPCQSLSLIPSVQAALAGSERVAAKRL